MAYLLDANVLITAKNLHYGFDFCPAFWEWIDEACADGLVASVGRVYDELIGRDDDLSGWARSRRHLFHDLTAEDVRAVAAVNRWANDSPDYEPAAKAEFADAADSFLVAHAMARGGVVVTHERISDGRRKIKIPNAALANGVKVATPFQMLRSTGARFVLPSAA